MHAEQESRIISLEGALHDTQQKLLRQRKDSGDIGARLDEALAAVEQERSNSARSEAMVQRLQLALDDVRYEFIKSDSIYYLESMYLLVISRYLK